VTNRVLICSAGCHWILKGASGYTIGLNEETNDNGEKYKLNLIINNDHKWRHHEKVSGDSEYCIKLPGS